MQGNLRGRPEIGTFFIANRVTIIVVWNIHEKSQYFMRMSVSTFLRFVRLLKTVCSSYVKSLNKKLFPEYFVKTA